MKYGIRSILIYLSDIFKVLRLKGPGALKDINIYQYFSTEICNIILIIAIQFETLQVV